MNWGWKITLVYLGFVAMIMTLVIKARSERVDLVAPDYYAQEIAYQGRIQAIQRAAELSGPVTLKITERGIQVNLPAECAGRVESGEIKLYRPSDASLDQRYPIGKTFTGELLIPSAALQTGHYLVQSSWVMDGQACYHEQSVLVP
ncbi:MAG: FixH family protein [Flavobacteriales bacterium]|jgi:hypothetical protein